VAEVDYQVPRVWGGREGADGQRLFESRLASAATKTQPTRRVGGVGIQKPGARRDGSQTLSLTPTTRFWRSVPAVVVDAQMWVAL
jgi:hypothetical protein